MTNNEFNSMSAGFQAFEAPEQTIEQLQAAPVQVLEQKEEASKAQNDLSAKYDRLNVRHKHILAERDALSKQVQELRRQLEDNPTCKRCAVDEIKLLDKLIDEERIHRDEIRKQGTLPPGYDAFVRHDKLVTAFLQIVSRGEK